MKIVHLLYSFTTGGAELLVIDLANYQAVNNQVWVVIINDRADQYLTGMLAPDIKMIFINRKESSVAPFKLLKFFYTLIKIKPDIIHCHHESLIKLLPAFEAKKVITIHDVGRALTGVEKYDIKVAISQAVYQDVIKRTNKQIVPIIIENGININRIKANDKLDFDGNIQLIQIGRLLHEKKGQDILIKAVKLLITEWKIINIKLNIIGVGPSLEYLQAMITELDLEGIVILHGLKDREWIYDHLKNFSILVQPSRFEGFGLTVVEAMMAKIPCLVSDIDGPIALIENGKYGFYFRSGEERSCATALHEIILSNKTALNEKVQGAYEHAVDTYSSKTMNEKYIQAYLN